MGSLSGAHEHKILKAAHEQIAREIEELTESALGMSRKELVERAPLGEDDGLRDELHRRFEQGKLSGKYPLLSGYLSDLPDEEKAEFFRTDEWLHLGTPPSEPLKKPWDCATYNGDEEWYREERYQGMASKETDLRMVAQEWLEELVRVGYHGFREFLSLPLKERINGSSISRPAAWPYDAYPVLFENTREMLWLQLDGERSDKRGYREPVVSDEPLRTDKAILAALTALKGGVIDIKRLSRALPKLKLPLGSSTWDDWMQGLEDQAKEDLGPAPRYGSRASEEVVSCTCTLQPEAPSGSVKITVP